MDNIILSKKHYFLTINQDIETICEPLKQFGIVYFNHARFFDDNSAYILTNGKDSIYNHVNKQYPIDKPAPKGTFGKKFHYFPFLDSTDINSKHVHAYRNEFNLENPIYFVEKYEGFTDVFVYSAMPDNLAILNFYLNNLEFLEKFKFYFKDKASKLIAKANKTRIILPKHMWTNYNDSKNLTINNNTKPSQKLTLKHYLLRVGKQEVSITKREFDVIKSLASGCSVKEAATTMGISPRTIETYLNNARYKLNVKKKSEIIKILADSNLL